MSHTMTAMDGRVEAGRRIALSTGGTLSLFRQRPGMYVGALGLSRA